MSDPNGSGGTSGFLGRTAAFWTMVGGVFAVIGVVVTIALAIPRPNGPTPTPGPTTAEPTTPEPTTSPPTTEPTADGDWHWDTTGAGPYACNYEGRIRSQPGGGMVQYEVNNVTDHEILLFWIDYSGSRQSVANVKAGERDSRTWQAGQILMIADYSADCVEIFSISGNGRVILSKE
ncbi:hypothetical protein [Streptomyces sclerotialus]|uniref:hypothetical protein n=1 Tax=Streptomyces sclerotialus TaxID=1957 RepID=UPI0004C9C835